jgi:ketopantoate reductase
MDSIAYKINPLSKLKIYSAVRKIILHKMNNDEIRPERAGEIIKYAKEKVQKINTARMAMQLCAELSEKYEELGSLPAYFENRNLEKMDELIRLIIDKFMEINDIETVDRLLARMEESNTAEKKQSMLSDLEKNHPSYFKKSLTLILNKNKHVK